MYFAHFPIIPYDSVGDFNFKVVTNLLKRVAVRTKVKSNTLYFDTYDVKEGERPEDIADKLYGDPELHWVVLMVNDITDRYHQWPMSGPLFIQYLNDKYTYPDGTHHFEIVQKSGDTTVKIDIGTVATDDVAIPITNREFEEQRQDTIRSIRLLDPEYVPIVVNQFKKLLGSSAL